MSVELICEACGEPNRPGSTFCSACRTYLGWQDAVPATAATGPPRPSPTRDADASPQIGSSDSSDTGEIEASGDAGGSSDAVDHPPPVPVPDRRAAMAGRTELRCPSCGQSYEQARRFCSRCGHQIVGPTNAATSPPPEQPSGFKAWWERHFDDRDRGARRAYRRSLPARYRWRRVIVGVVVVALVVAGAVLSGGRPVQWARERWYGLLNRTEVVPGVVATAEPASGTVRGSDPARLTDNDVASWTAPWAPRGKAVGCGPPRGTPSVRLDFEPRQIRRVNVWPGLPEDDQDRRLQARPHWVTIDLGEGRCVRHELRDSPEMQAVDVPAGSAVSRIRFSIADAYLTKGGKPQLSLTEIQLLAQPR